MKSKIILVAVIFSVLTGCQTSTMKQRPHFEQTPVLESTETTFRPMPSTTVMLLPLSGPQKAVGEALQQAGMMAQVERRGNQMELVFFDTHGTAEGAVAAYEKALQVHPDVILGPVFSAEVAAIAKQDPNIPVISFTSDNSVLTDNVYTMALLIPSQVQRIVDFACTSGKRRLAVMGPENKTGELVMNALSESIKVCPGMTLEKVSLYAPKTVNLDPAVLKIIPKPIDPKKKDLTPEEQEILATPLADRLTFDALFIFEDGVRLQQLVSLLSFYDVTPTVVPFYGLSNWQKSKDKNLAGAYFPNLPTFRYQPFVQNYRAAFGTSPMELAGFAYDAVSLASFLNMQRAMNPATLTAETGYNGVHGYFRFLPDGTNERLLGISQKTRRGHLPVEPAAETFERPVFEALPDETSLNEPFNEFPNVTPSFEQQTPLNTIPAF